MVLLVAVVGLALLSVVAFLLAVGALFLAVLALGPVVLLVAVGLLLLTVIVLAAVDLPFALDALPILVVVARRLLLVAALVFDLFSRRCVVLGRRDVLAFFRVVKLIDCALRVKKMQLG